MRLLHNPDTWMRSAQFRICAAILNRITVPSYIYAFERDKNIPGMAANHVRKKVIVSLDIKDFFHSIKQRTLQELFGKYGFGEKPARTLSELCTFKSYVPQGAITSPKISNLIAADSFGPRIKQYCDDKGLTLTIYADDITVSSDDKDAPVGDIIREITSIVSSFGFRINTKKTKVMRTYHRQYVCGVVVNEKTNMMKKERLRLRAIVHNLAMNGAANEALKNKTTPENFINVIRGRINWFRQLNQVQGSRLMSKFNEALARWNLDTGAALEQPSSLDNNTEIPEPHEIPWGDTQPAVAIA